MDRAKPAAGRNGTHGFACCVRCWRNTGWRSATIGVTTSYIVGNRKGDQRLAAAMGELWRVAEQMAGKPLDPLDEGLLDRLRNIESNA